MKKEEINQKIAELKMEYLRLQDDMERLESFGRSVDKQEQKLLEIENELKYYNALQE
ncbi:SE1832 family protein [Pontibacillus sp. HMF3514]|uniref:SE1832 family protein n=1 Tax=Pontibacillus sp. HMF3514 TaxID=2692425 RepID=UPI001916F716|nr:SE1832 family protein [Pontibacillus sp. HMF3514]